MGALALVVVGLVSLGLGLAQGPGTRVWGATYLTYFSSSAWD